ncbi:hypothetical protein [Alkalibacterium sp. 20]|uniref:hypothetical protein n=1 Tax=Alkalibacterium sp. 20 TaxID=1798803 RepID=UPI0008FFFFC6|nr:hypothetical protein [Alkalibacterium sp. 20]OJF94591.1 hypothetical protein AX762_01615 [Alkalibacterium sp. 20]
MIDELKCPYCGNQTVEESERQQPEVSDKYKCGTCGKTFGLGANESIRQCHTFCFTYGGFHGGFKTILIEERDGYADIQITAPYSLGDDILKVRITVDEWQTIKTYLFRELFVLSWDEDYYDSNIMDGTQWELKLKFDNRKKFKVAGSNLFPALFDELLEYLDPYFKQVGA